MKDDIPILQVNRGSLTTRDDLEIQVEHDQIRITLALTQGQEAKTLEIKAFQHHLEISMKDRLLHCLTLPQAVEPDSLSIKRKGCSAVLALRIKQGSGHPKPIRPAADERSEGCVEHPRSRASAVEAEKGQSA